MQDGIASGGRTRSPIEPCLDDVVMILPGRNVTAPVQQPVGTPVEYPRSAPVPRQALHRYGSGSHPVPYDILGGWYPPAAL
jgi:hypothetical protein